MPDAFHLERFVKAQSGIYAQVLGELRDGRKRTHWMWFVFPQLAGLGRSPTAVHFALSGRAEAMAYLAHAVLGPQLIACTEAVDGLAGNRSATEIFSVPDDLKFRSSMTLFSAVAPDPAPFETALDRYFSGKADERTLDLLRDSDGSRQKN